MVKPLVPTLVAWRFLPGNLAGRIVLAATFVVLDVLINSRLGRNFEEALIDWCVESWHRFGIRFLVGLFWWFVDLFRRLMQLIERLMYAVDEWLRFKSGQGRSMMVLKGFLGTLWFFVAYGIRFCVNLLVEPQLNPVKHVPWVTVSHKILAPMWIAMNLHGVLAQRMNGAVADVLTFLIVTLTPGIFGYLVWELKENWRLFAANRPKTLDPVLVGSHGESLPRLLRPGLHSGTIPKRFAKLRRAERKAALAGGDPRTVRKHRELLHHVEISLRRYIEREFIAWFKEGRGWPLPPPQVEDIHLGHQRDPYRVGAARCQGPAGLGLRTDRRPDAHAAFRGAAGREPCGSGAEGPPPGDHQRREDGRRRGARLRGRGRRVGRSRAALAGMGRDVGDGTTTCRTRNKWPKL